jgi:hypothetical protein
MREIPVSRLAIEDVMKLLDVETVSWEPWQLERLRTWIERLVDTRGQDYVRENRRDILSQWEQYAKAKFKSCV